MNCFFVYMLRNINDRATLSIYEHVLIGGEHFNKYHYFMLLRICYIYLVNLSDP